VEIFNKHKNDNNQITKDEFALFLEIFINNSENNNGCNDYDLLRSLVLEKEEVNQHLIDDHSEDDEDDEDDGEMPEDLLNLSARTQQRWIIFRSLYTMAFGTSIVMIFSEPMVAVFDALGTALGIDNF